MRAPPVVGPASQPPAPTHLHFLSGVAPLEVHPVQHIPPPASGADGPAVAHRAAAHCKGPRAQEGGRRAAASAVWGMWAAAAVPHTAAEVYGGRTLAGGTVIAGLPSRFPTSNKKRHDPPGERMAEKAKATPVAFVRYGGSGRRMRQPSSGSQVGGSTPQYPPAGRQAWMDGWWGGRARTAAMQPGAEGQFRCCTSSSASVVLLRFPRSHHHYTVLHRRQRSA